MILVRQPPAALAPYVESLWFYDGQADASQRERVLPNGRFQIVFDLHRGRGSVAGLRSRSVVVETGAIPSLLGVVLRPGGTRGFFEAPASDFHDQVLPLDAVWARATRVTDRLQEAAGADGKFGALEHALLGALEKTRANRLALHPAVEYALATLARAPRLGTLTAVTREMGLSRRRLAHWFRAQVGMTPKRYCRLQRFLRVVRTAASGAAIDWADVAAAGGYCDQAHLSRDFQEFAGLPPARFLAAERPSPTHVRIG